MNNHRFDHPTFSPCKDIGVERKVRDLTSRTSILTRVPRCLPAPVSHSVLINSRLLIIRNGKKRPPSPAGSLIALCACVSDSIISRDPYNRAKLRTALFAPLPFPSPRDACPIGTFIPSPRRCRGPFGAHCAHTHVRARAHTCIQIARLDAAREGFPGSPNAVSSSSRT